MFAAYLLQAAGYPYPLPMPGSYPPPPPAGPANHRFSPYGAPGGAPSLPLRPAPFSAAGMPFPPPPQQLRLPAYPSSEQPLSLKMPLTPPAVIQQRASPTSSNSSGGRTPSPSYGDRSSAVSSPSTPPATAAPRLFQPYNLEKA